MNIESLDLPAIVASLIILAVLAASAILWILRIQRPENDLLAHTGAPAWPIGWVNFGIFVCVLVTAVVLFQNLMIAGFIDRDGGGVPAMTPTLAIVAVISLQLPMLLVFYGLRRFFPGQFAGRLNGTPMGITEAFKRAVPIFLRLLPIIWVASFVWSLFLNSLKSLGAIEALPPQQLVILFEAGGAPLAIATLVLFAIVCAPVIEELIFRGCIYRFLKSQTAPIFAQIGSGAFFAVMHGNLLSFTPLLVVGFLLAKVYEAEGNLLVPIFFHAFFNAFSLLILFIMSNSALAPA